MSGGVLRVNWVGTTERAFEIVKSLSRPGKMPCPGYSIPAKNCITGAQLAKQKGTICNECYAMRGWYPKREDFLQARQDALQHPEWIDAMTYLILDQQMPFFRWHDSGDLQGVWHLEKILQVVQNTPNCKHWLPTREYGIIQDYWRQHGRKSLSKSFPNLSIRLSATMFDGELPTTLAKMIGVQTSGVNTSDYNCPAYSGTPEHTYIDHGEVIHGACGPCRKCWDQDIFSVIYKRH